MSHRQMPYANFLEVKKLDSQACNIYAMLAIFKSRIMHESPGWRRLILGDALWTGLVNYEIRE